MANEFVIKNGFHSKGDSQVTGSLNVSGSITGSLFGTASYVSGNIFTSNNLALSSSHSLTASYALNAGGGSGTGFPFSGSAIITGSLLISQSGIFVTGTLSTNQDAVVNSIDIGLGQGSSNTNLRLGTDALDNTIPGTVSGYDVGRYNSAIGYQALQNNRSGSFNTAIGYNALNTLGSGSFDKVTNYTLLDATNNTAIGYFAGFRLESGSRNIAIGTNAMYNNKNAASNVAIGYNSMFYYASGSSFSLVDISRKNIAIGENSLRGSSTLQNTSENNIAIGSSALLNCTTGRYNVGIGTNVLSGNPLTAEGNIAIGLQAMQVATTGYTNIALGVNALNNLTTGYQNTAIGGNTLKRILVERNHVAIGINAMEFASSSAGDTNYSNVSIGVEAGRYMTGSRNVALGYQAMYQSSGSSGTQLSVAIGYQALYGVGNGTNGAYNMAIGYRSMYNAGGVGQNLAFGYSSLESLKEGSGNLIIGNRAAQFMSASNDVLAIGRVALQNAKRVQQIIAIGESSMLNQYPTDTGTMLTAASVAIGYKALQGVAGNTNTGVRNTAIGDNSSQFNSTGNDNTAIGYGTLNQNLTGINNIAIGSNALFYATGSDNTSIGYYSGRLISGSNNVAIGSYALNVQHSGVTLNNVTNNTAIGYGAGRYISSSAGNIFIGYNAGPPAVSGDAKTVVNNKLYISNTTGNPLIGGDFDAKTVTISGSLLMSGSIIPNAGTTQTSSFSLGSPTAAWKGLYVSSGSIHFVDDVGSELAKISADPSGQIIVPNIYTSGSFTAQTFITQSTTTIIEYNYATGSTKFGSSSLDTHQFTGSVYMSNSLDVNGVSTLYNTNINGNLTTTGSVLFTGLQNSNQNYLVSINPGTGQLYYTASSAFIPINPDLSGFATTGSNTFYGNQIIYDSDSIISIETSTGVRRLYDFNTNTSVDWDNRVLYDDINVPSINYGSRELRDESSTTLLEYSNNQIRLTQDVLMTGLNQNTADSVITIDSITGQLYYTSSAAFVTNLGDLTSLNEFSSSILNFTSSAQAQINSLTNATSSYVLNSQTGSMTVATASYVTGSVFDSTNLALSSSYSLTASYALNSTATVDTSSLVTTSSFNAFTSSIQGQVNSLTSATSSYVLNSVTASMLSPYVLNASTSSMTVLSSSFSNTASYVNTLNQTITITGSINISGSIIAREVSASFTGSLTGHVTSSTIDTAQYKLKNNSGVATVNWNSGIIGFPDLGLYSINWGSRYLYDNNNDISIDWNGKTLKSGSNTSIDWLNRSLKDSSNVQSIDYNSRILYNNAGGTSLVYNTENELTVKGPVTTHLYSAFLIETEKSESANYYAGELYQTNSYPNTGLYGELVYLDYSTNEWVRIDQTSAVCTRYIGIDIDNKIGVLTEGHIVMTDAADPFSGGIPQIENPLIGMPVYIIEGSNGRSDNSYTCNIPTSGYVRVIGYVMYKAVTSGYETKYMIKFKPSNDWYEI